MPKILIGYLTAGVESPLNAMLLRRDGAAADLQVVHDLAAAREFIASCDGGSDPPRLAAAALSAMAVCGLSETSTSTPARLAGNAVAALWQAVCAAYASDGPDTHVTAPMVTGHLGLASLWVPTTAGASDAFVSHTGHDGKHRLTFIRSKRQLLEVLERYRAVEKRSDVAAARAKVAACTLPEDSSSPPDEIVGGVADLVLTALFLRRHRENAN